MKVSFSRGYKIEKKIVSKLKQKSNYNKLELIFIELNRVPFYL